MFGKPITLHSVLFSNTNTNIKKKKEEKIIMKHKFGMYFIDFYFFTTKSTNNPL